MNDSRRRLQFGLRKLLLWTAAVALYFATVRWVAMDVRGFAVVTFCAGVVGILRAAFGPLVAASLSVIAGGIVFALKDWPASPWLGCLAGWLVFVFLETVSRAVDWADKVLETKTDGETRRD